MAESGSIIIMVSRKNGDDPWAPFKDKEEWELAQWLITNVGQNATDKYLKLPIVSLFSSVSPRSKLKVTLSDM